MVALLVLTFWMEDESGKFPYLPSVEGDTAIDITYQYPVTLAPNAVVWKVITSSPVIYESDSNLFVLSSEEV